MLANRVNTFTGVAYKDEPAILAWEIGNELRCSSCRGTSKLPDAVRELAAFLRQVAPNQLISDGGDGFDDNPQAYVGLTNFYAVRGDEGASFTRMADIDELDMLSYHLYPNNYGFIDGEGHADSGLSATRPSRSPPARSPTWASAATSPPTPSARSSYDAWLSHLFAGSGGQLGLMWQLSPSGRRQQRRLLGVLAARQRHRLDSGALGQGAAIIAASHASPPPPRAPRHHVDRRRRSRAAAAAGPRIRRPHRRRRTVTETTAQPIRLMLKPEGGLSFDVRDAKTGDPIPCKLTLVGVDGTPDPGVHAHRHRPPGGRRADRVQPHHVADRHRRRARAARHLRRHRQPRARVGHRHRAQAEDHAARARSSTARLAHVVDSARLGLGRLPRARRRVARLARADARPHLRVRRRRRADDRLHRPQRDLRLRPDHPRARRRPLHRQRRRRRADHRQLGTLRRVPAAARARAARPGRRRWCTGATPPTSSRTCAAARPTPSSTCTTRASTTRSATSTSATSTRAPTARRAPASRGTSTRVEVMNGYQDPVRKSVDTIIDDWFALLNHGHIVTATGNSDTHHLTYNIGGYPRNYVHVQDDRPQSVDGKQVAHRRAQPPLLLHDRAVRARQRRHRHHRRPGAGAAAARRTPTSRCRPRPGSRSIA